MKKEGLTRLNKAVNGTLDYLIDPVDIIGPRRSTFGSRQDYEQALQKWSDPHLIAFCKWLLLDGFYIGAGIPTNHFSLPLAAAAGLVGVIHFGCVASATIRITTPDRPA